MAHFPRLHDSRTFRITLSLADTRVAAFLDVGYGMLVWATVVLACGSMTGTAA